MKTEQEIRTLIAEAETQRQQMIIAIDNQIAALKWALGIEPEQPVQETPEPPSDEPVITPPAELEGAQNGHRASRRR